MPADVRNFAFLKRQTSSSYQNISFLQFEGVGIFGPPYPIRFDLSWYFQTGRLGDWSFGRLGNHPCNPFKSARQGSNSCNPFKFVVVFGRLGYWSFCRLGAPLNPFNPLNPCSLSFVRSGRKTARRRGGCLAVMVTEVYFRTPHFISFSACRLV